MRLCRPGKQIAVEGEPLHAEHGTELLEERVEVAVEVGGGLLCVVTAEPFVHELLLGRIVLCAHCRL